MKKVTMTQKFALGFAAVAALASNASAALTLPVITDYTAIETSAALLVGVLVVVLLIKKAVSFFR